MQIALAEDCRQRVADVVAVMVLARMDILETEPDFCRLGPMVSVFCALQSPETPQNYSAMGWEKAIGAIKIACANHYLASYQAGPDETLPPAVDARIGRCLVAAFMRFLAFQSVSPAWYAPYLDQMPLTIGSGQDA